MNVGEGRPRLRLVVFASIWISIAFWPVRVAARKGHSFLAYFVLSLGFFPLALLLAYRAEDLQAEFADQWLEDQALEDQPLVDGPDTADEALATKG